MGRDEHIVTLEFIRDAPSLPYILEDGGSPVTKGGRRRTLLVGFSSVRKSVTGPKHLEGHENRNRLRATSTKHTSADYSAAVIEKSTSVQEYAIHWYTNVVLDSPPDA